MKVLATILSLAVFCGQLLAQDYEFRVLAKIGQSTVKSGSADWQPLKPGSTLQKSDQIKLESGDYVGLVHNSGLTMELKDPGVQQVSALSQKVMAGKKSLGEKYANYIAEKMANATDGTSLAATGAVTRSAGGKSIDLIAPSSLEVYNVDHTLIEWNSKEGVDTYIVTLMNMFDEEIQTYETSDTTLYIDMKEALKDQDEINQGYLKVRVSSKEDTYTKSDDVTLKKITNDELKANIDGYIEEISSQADELTALDFFVLANVYEQENLFLDALSSYNRAIDLAPEVAYYKEAKADFLNRWTKPIDED